MNPMMMQESPDKPPILPLALPDGVEEESTPLSEGRVDPIPLGYASPQTPKKPLSLARLAAIEMIFIGGFFAALIVLLDASTQVFVGRRVKSKLPVEVCYGLLTVAIILMITIPRLAGERTTKRWVALGLLMGVSLLLLIT